MGNIVPLRATGALTRNDSRRLDLFCKTVGKELVGAEIDEALEWCQLYGANPFTRDIYFFVFDAKDAEKRRVVPVLGIGLYRKIAARSGDYRPDDQPPRFAYDEAAKSAANPTGMLWCEVTVFRYSHGSWHAIPSRLKWEERAPIKAGGFRWVDTGETWPDSGKPKKRKIPDDSVASLDEKKTNWHTMPETMMAKCCEADAIRKGWPSEVSGSYVPEEMDAPHTIDLTATEIVEKQRQSDRLARIGGDRAVTVDWCDGRELARVSVGQFGDRAIEWIKAATPVEVAVWAGRNKHALNEYWALDANGCLAVKAEIEAKQSQQDAAE